MESNQSNGAAIRAFHVVEVVAQHVDGCSFAELVAAVDLPKQTVHRLVSQLQLAGLLIREPAGKRLQLGARLETFATNAMANGPARRERHAILRSLVERTGETCNITTLVGTDVVYLDRVETEWPLRVILAPGSHVPLHATSSGKLLLSLQPKAQRDRIVRRLRLRRFTDTTIVDVAALERELVETRSRRVGLNRAEHLHGMCGMALPVMLDRQRACAAVAVQAPEARMPLPELLRYLPLLKEAAEEIGRTFVH